MPAILAPGTPFRAWVAVVAWMALTVMLSTFPIGGVQPSVPDADKLGHAAVYGVLAFLTARAWRRHGSGPGAVVERTLALALLFGALMELVQSQVGRDPSFGDWVADGVGALLGIGCWKAWTIVAGITLERGR